MSEQDGLIEAADAVADLLRKVMDAATRPGKAMPTYGECETALIAYEQARDKAQD